MSPFVLYVDDDAANLVVFESSLRGALPVLTAGSGAEALALMRTHEVAVLITDQRMPGMTGVQLVSTVRAEFPETVRMLVTAYSDLDAAIDAINQGQVHYYLRKPWEPSELKLALTQARDRYLAARRLTELERRLLETERVYALGVVAAGVAHEIRNPLTAVLTSLEMARAALAGPVRTEANVAEAAMLVADALKSAHGLLDITRSMDLTTRSRKDSEVDLREVVELALRVVSPTLRMRARVELALEPVPPVWASSTRLGQVVMNLLVNAVEALDPARAPENRVRVALARMGDGLELSVSDNGKGIPESELPRIFDPFFTTKQDGGTGLGLAISRRIVAELGGEISAASIPGAGTTFVVRLPLRAGPT